MKAIGKGCLELFLVWFTAGAVLYPKFHRDFGLPSDFWGPDFWGAFIGGLLLSFAWGSLRNAIVALSRGRLLQNARNGSVQPRDGKTFAIAGQIRPLGAPLNTPFQKKTCVAYGYDAASLHPVRYGSGSSSTSTTEKKTYFGGFAMCPAAIRSGVIELKILSFPFPYAFPEEKIPIAALGREAHEHLQNTNFGEDDGAGFFSALGEMKKLFADDDGSHRYDWKSKNAEDAFEDLHTYILEQYIPVDAEVCVIGKYSRLKGGLINDFAAGGLEVIPGSVESGIRLLFLRAVWGLVFASLFGIAGSIGTAMVLEWRAGHFGSR